MKAEHGDNILLNGLFLPALFNRSSSPASGTQCLPWRQTFLADRWKVRFGDSSGDRAWQALSTENPSLSSGVRSLELRASDRLESALYLGQRIEAADAFLYQKRLHFSAWIWSTTVAPHESVRLHLTTPERPNCFGNALNHHSRLVCDTALGPLPGGQWTRVEQEIDARSFSPTGLSLELGFAPDLFCDAAARVRVTDVYLGTCPVTLPPPQRSAAMEQGLCRRFFQRLGPENLNSIGRPIVVNPNEMHFQLTFAEMREFPACTIPQDNGGLRVFDLTGRPQHGFSYDVTYRSRGSAILRATRFHHGLSDGYLSFVGDCDAIELEAEL